MRTEHAAMSDRLPTHDEIAEKLRYDEYTGKFYWLVKPARNVYAGSEAGCVKATGVSNGNRKGHLYIRIDGFTFTGGQLAWLLHYGEWPRNRLRFEDGDTLNLKISNLSLANGLDAKFDHSDGAQRKTYMKEHREAHPLAWKESHLRQSFGISLNDYHNMVAAQGNKCAMCGEAETEMRGGEVKALAVDHNHSTGKVRGLLCSACNKAIGLLKEDRELFFAGVRYLDKHSDAGIVPFVPKAETK